MKEWENKVQITEPKLLKASFTAFILNRSDWANSVDPEQSDKA